MKYPLHIYKIVLLLSPAFTLSVEVSSNQKGSSYFFYQQPEYPQDCKEARDQCSSNNVSGFYTIKPVGYPEAFEVYCNNDISSGGWTVIQRHIDGSLTFKRGWEEYKEGFGFLATAYWIGHDKLSYLTNQAVYELRIDIVLANGSSFYVKYNSFRLSDESSHYAIVYATGFHSNWSCVVSTCPIAMARENCTCQSLCTDPIGKTDCYTECVETCVPGECFVTETNSYITNGESFISPDCTQHCTCINNQLNCNEDYECSTDATCANRGGMRRCYCNDGYDGNGQTCVKTSFRDCFDAYQVGHFMDGIYTILPMDWPGSAFDVFCNMTFNDRGWTVVQRRTDGVTDFFRNWEEYKQGFGTLNEGNDFWLGNEKLHYLTQQKNYNLRIDFVHSSDQLYFEEYTVFKIGNESTKYQLGLDSFGSGNTRSGSTGGDHYYLEFNNGEQFSTFDQDNDGCSNYHFADRHKGGWWYTNTWCTNCYGSNCRHFEYGGSGCHTLGTYTNPNGDYNGSNAENIFYFTLDRNDCNHKFFEMKIRPFTS